MFALVDEQPVLSATVQSGSKGVPPDMLFTQVNNCCGLAALVYGLPVQLAGGLFTLDGYCHWPWVLSCCRACCQEGSQPVYQVFQAQLQTAAAATAALAEAGGGT